MTTQATIIERDIMKGEHRLAGIAQRQRTAIKRDYLFTAVLVAALASVAISAL